MYIDKLFDLEKKIHGKQDVTFDAIKKFRKEKEVPVLEGFWKWFEVQHAVKWSCMYKALTYIENRRPYLETYLDDGGCSFNNNTSEKSCEAFVTGWKNWMFSDTPDGANASALVYSLVETAKPNGVDIYYYLKYLLLKTPTSQTSDEELEKLCPWNPECKEALEDLHRQHQKYQYEVLKNYANEKNQDLLFALFWRKSMIWTVVPIEAFDEKSSVYKKSFEKAFLNDVSAIFGDYMYVFNEDYYRKSVFSKYDSVESEYIHEHFKYGRTVYEGLSKDGKDYSKIDFLMTPMLDALFDFRAVSVVEGNYNTELIEKIDKLPYHYRLSYVILRYLLKIYCYEKSDMYLHENSVVENAFNIVDTIRRECCGKKYYLVPRRNAISEKLFKAQFGKSDWIVNTLYIRCQDGQYVLASHDMP